MCAHVVADVGEGARDTDIEEGDSRVSVCRSDLDDSELVRVVHGERGEVEMGREGLAVLVGVRFEGVRQLVVVIEFERAVDRQEVELGTALDVAGQPALDGDAFVGPAWGGRQVDEVDGVSCRRDPAVGDHLVLVHATGRRSAQKLHVHAQDDETECERNDERAPLEQLSWF